MLRYTAKLPLYKAPDGVDIPYHEPWALANDLLLLLLLLLAGQISWCQWLQPLLKLAMVKRPHPPPSQSQKQVELFGLWVIFLVEEFVLRHISFKCSYHKEQTTMVSESWLGQFSTETPSNPHASTLLWILHGVLAKQWLCWAGGLMTLKLTHGDLCSTVIRTFYRWETTALQVTLRKKNNY